jgi:hypothetical protein
MEMVSEQEHEQFQENYVLLDYGRIPRIPSSCLLHEPPMHEQQGESNHPKQWGVLT